jgi:hypothetical protein
MFLIGIALVISIVLIYLLIKKLTNNDNLALFSVLLLSFSDFHIQWSIEIIAMSFGIITYTVIIYILISGTNHINYRISLLIFSYLLIWTHTISSFITLVSIIFLYIGSVFYSLALRFRVILDDHEISKFELKPFLLLIFIIVMLYHWMDPNYPFFEGTARGFFLSLMYEAKVLDYPIDVFATEWETLLNISGFLMLILFGVLGSLYHLSPLHLTKQKCSLLVMIIGLFSIFFAFPVLGLKNILPQRWPPFIYLCFVLFAATGVIIILSSCTGNRFRITACIFISLIYIFFMITNSYTNMDSPIYGKQIFGKNIWTESEMALLVKLEKTYNSDIVTDLQTGKRPLETYLRNDNTHYFRLSHEGDIDYSYLYKKLVFWRYQSLCRPVAVDSRPRRLEINLGNEFKYFLDLNFCCISDAGLAKAYLNL